MFVRLALEKDTPEIIEMSRAACYESCPEDEFSVKRFSKTVKRSFDHADPTFFICEDRGHVKGLLAARICDFDYKDGLFVTQRFLYVKPEYRGSRAAALLMNQLIEWADRLGAICIEGGNDNEFHSERTRKFLEHFGFEFTGYAMRRMLNGQKSRPDGRAGSGGSRGRTGATE
jgi:GNAT superfamily N-acetyltransferase